MRSRVMKTRIFIFLTILNIVLFNIKVKGTEVDTTNLIKPEILDTQCGNNPFSHWEVGPFIIFSTRMAMKLIFML